MNEPFVVHRAGIAGDLIHGIPDAQLIKRVLEAVNHVDGLLPPSLSKDVNPAQVVTLLTFCYAKGIYGSEEIEARLDESPIAYICAGVKPDWHLLRRFRRNNVFVLIEALAELLGRLGNRGCWVVNPRDEARRRVQMAIQTDSMAMDQ